MVASRSGWGDTGAAGGAAAVSSRAPLAVAMLAVRESCSIWDW